MTPSLGVDIHKLPEPEVNWRNFQKACQIAKDTGVITAMFTGKGEPTIFPKQITKFMDVMSEFRFPLIELQTNGILLATRPDIYNTYLNDWYERGMTLVAISIVHYDSDKNREVYLSHRPSAKYFDLPALVAKLHKIGFSVRLTCVLTGGFIDSWEKLQRLIEYAKAHKVEQLTITPVNRPDGDETISQDVWKQTEEHQLTPEQFKDISDNLEKNGSPLLKLSHGAIIYDVFGQNVCLNNCLKVIPDTTELRNLIFFPDGHLRYYWQYPGAIIL